MPATWGNKKLPDDVAIMGNLPAGWTCPGAKDCLSKADPKTGKIKDGKGISHRCYAASVETLRKQVRDAHNHNLKVLKGKSAEEMARIIFNSVPVRAKTVRLHDSGDFFSQDHFDAWLAVAEKLPGVTFYAYTKSLPYWVSRRDSIPDNFILTASKGDKYDDMIDAHRLKSAEVVMSPEEAEGKGLEIDTDDSLAQLPDEDFALLIHGGQPKGSEAGKAVRANRKRAKAGGLPHALPKNVTYGDLKLREAEEPAEDGEALMLIPDECDEEGTYDVFF